MSRPATPVESDRAGDSERVERPDSVDPAAHGERADAGPARRQSVSELVRSYGDSLTTTDGHKRNRSESGDPAPAGKRGARDRGGEPAHSPSTPGTRRVKGQLDQIPI